jgi:Cu/Ag efflux pump CusA
VLYWFINWSVKFRRIVIASGAGLLIFGFLQLDDVKQDILPEFSPTTVEVQTEALGLSAAEVERLITTPLEQDLLNGVAFLDTIESTSMPGLSSVVMTFESGTDLLDARQVVAERLTQAAGLPQVADPPQMIQPHSSTSRVAMVSLESTELTPIEVSVLARWLMVPRLLGVEGVANVSIWGFRDRQFQVLVDPADLASHNVSLSQVIRTAGNALEVSQLSFLEASTPGTGGFIDTVNQRLHVFHEQTISTPDQLAQVTVEGPEGGAVFVAGEPLPLGAIAEIVVDHQPLIGDALCSGSPCVLLIIEKFPDANTPEVVKDLGTALDALRLGLPGMEIDSSIYQPAAFIDASLDNLLGALLVGVVLMLVLVGVLSFSWRVAVVSAASIVLALVTTGVILLILDVTVNVMILAGLVMALVVILDDAILGTWVSAEEAGDQSGRAELGPAMVDSILRLRNVAIIAAVIVAVALLPVAAMEGVEGAFLEPIVLAYLLAVAIALVVSLTVAPALSVLLLAHRPTKWPEARLSVRLRDWYRGLAARLVPKIRRALAVFGVFILAGLVVIPFLSTSLRPSLKERDVLVQLQAAPGTSLPRMREITAQMADELRSLPGVDNAGVHIGRAIMSDRVVVVRVYGENSEVRQEVAEQVRGAMIGVDGIGSPRIAAPVEEPVIEIEVDLQRAQAFGVKPGDVRRQATTLVSGIGVGNIFEDQKVFDVVVWGVPEIRETVEDVQALPISTPSGDHVPLGELADVRVVSSPTVIRHESVASYLDVSASMDGGQGGVANHVEERLAELRFPLEYHAEVLGGLADERAGRSRVIAVGFAALIGVYLLLQAAFASWRLATIAFLGLPMSVSGSLLAIAATGGQVTLGSGSLRRGHRHR